MRMGMDTDDPMPGTGQDAVVLQGDFAWDLETGPSLTQLDLKVPVGSLVTIVGQTGSGKSSVLAAALGLMNQTEGPAPQVHGKVSPRTRPHHVAEVLACSGWPLHHGRLVLPLLLYSCCQGSGVRLVCRDNVSTQVRVAGCPGGVCSAVGVHLQRDSSGKHPVWPTI